MVMPMQEARTISSELPVESDCQTHKVLLNNLAGFLKDEKINMKLRKISDSEFWLEGPHRFLTASFFVDKVAHEITCDVFSPKYHLHLKDESFRGVKKLELILDEKARRDCEKSIEDLWLVLDCVKMWAQKSGFCVKEELHE
jgi:hypothetical protein